MSAERLEPKGKQSSPGCLTLSRRELTGLPVYRADLNPPVWNAEHGNAAGLDYAGRGRPNRKAGRAGAALGWPKKPMPVGNEPDMPMSVWSGKARRVCGTDSIGNCNRRATPVARCTQNCCPKERSHEGHSQVLPSCPTGLVCVLVTQPISSNRGSARKGLALNRFEPCEWKLSRIVLRGA